MRAVKRIAAAFLAVTISVISFVTPAGAESKYYIKALSENVNVRSGPGVTYDKLGISDVGYMYWLRLMNGNNSIMFHGNCEFIIEHIEARKVGE